jgi:hypothetical protein
MSTFIMRNQYGVHPDDEHAVESKVKEVLRACDALDSLSIQALEQVWIIGGLLIELKGKVYHGQWMSFCRDHFRRISHYSITNYMQLAHFRPRLLDHLKLRTGSEFELAAADPAGEVDRSRLAKQLKLDTYSDELPGIKAALKIIQGWTKRKKSASSREVRLKEYCPTCGQVITKPARAWMKEHSGKR